MKRIIISFILTFSIILNISGLNIYALSDNRLDDVEIDEHNMSFCESDSSVLSLTITNKESVFVETLDSTIVLDCLVNSSVNYDYIIVSYISTNNILLDSYQDTRIEYQDDSYFSLSFIVNDVFESATYSNTKEGKILITASAYDNNEIVAEVETDVAVLTTPYGYFVSYIDIEIAEAYYYDWLLKEAIIDDNVYNELERSMHSPKYCATVNNKLMSEITTLSKETTISMLEDDIYMQNMIDLNNQTYIIDDQGTQISGLALRSTGSSDAISVSMTYRIEALNSATQLKVSGNVTYTDINSVSHAAVNVKIKIFDDDPIGEKLLATVSTDNTGTYSVIFNNETGIFENGCDVYIELYAQVYDIPVERPSGTYYMYTPTISNVMSTQPMGIISSGTSSLFAQALFISQAFNVGCAYASSMNNGTIIKPNSVVYPRIDGDVSMYNSVWNKIYMTEASATYWDVILHEYGHCIAHGLGITDSPGGSHSSYDNLALTSKSKSKGVRLAWSEGWATYFSISAQVYMSATSLNIPYVGDTCYDTTGNEIETNTVRALGEANERAVSRILFDFADNTPTEDSINIGYQAVWNLCKNNGCVTLSEFMEVAYAYIGKNRTNYNNIGACLVDQYISAEAIDAYWDEETQTFTFIFSPAEYSAYNTYDYEIMVVKNDNLLTYTTIAATIPYRCQISKTEYESLQSQYKNGFYWCLITKGTDESPVTGPYYSNFIWHSYE